MGVHNKFLDKHITLDIGTMSAFKMRLQEKIPRNYSFLNDCTFTIWQLTHKGLIDKRSKDT